MYISKSRSPLKVYLDECRKFLKMNADELFKKLKQIHQYGQSMPVVKAQSYGMRWIYLKNKNFDNVSSRKCLYHG